MSKKKVPIASDEDMRHYDDALGQETQPEEKQQAGDNAEGLVEPDYIKIGDVKLGDTLHVMGDEFDCLHDGASVEVMQNENGRLYVECEEGRHFLDRATDLHDYVLGLGVKK